MMLPMPEEFQINMQGEVLHLVINLPRLDASSAAQLKQKLSFDLDPSIRKAEVDMASIQFIDSSGIGVLLSIYRKLPQDGAEVILRNVQSGVQAVIELLRLHRVFKVQ
jgi:anti-sigma B factor antagonist